MRVDKFLKNARLIKRRTVAKQAADGGRIEVNGRTAKAGTEVAAGDTMKIAFGNKTLEIEILAVPETVRKEQAQEMYRVIGEDE